MSEAYKIKDPQGIYFITATVVNWNPVFIRPEYKQVVVESLKYCQENKGLRIHSWCIMANHVHMIVSATGKPLSDILRDFKRHTATSILRLMDTNQNDKRRHYYLQEFREAGMNNCHNRSFQFWIQDNHPIELYSNNVIEQKIDYIHENPVKAGIVCAAKDYKFSSAHEDNMIELDAL
jgi:putative transposase